MGKASQRVSMSAMPTALRWDMNFNGSPLSWDSADVALIWEGSVINKKQPTVMASDNRISMEITAAQKAAFVSAIAALKAALDGILINLNKDERQSLPKIADKTLAFDEKCKAYMASRPELVPSFLDLAELAKDRKLIDDLLPCLREIAPICEGLEDTISLAYTDVFVADLAFHANVKQAAKRGVAGTDTIYDDLKTRFPGRPKAEPPAPGTP